MSQKRYRSITIPFINWTSLGHRLWINLRNVACRPICKYHNNTSSRMRKYVGMKGNIHLRYMYAYITSQICAYLAPGGCWSCRYSSSTMIVSYTAQMSTNFTCSWSSAINFRLCYPSTTANSVLSRIQICTVHKLQVWSEKVRRSINSSVVSPAWRTSALCRWITKTRQCGDKLNAKWKF